jgi:CRISPR-associated protein Cas2
MPAWVIGYDIADPRRLGRVYRQMQAHATPIEYSVFMLEGSREDLARCMRAVLALIDAGEDDVRCYQLPSRGLKDRLGKAVLPEGIQWTGLPAGFLL